MKFDVIIGTLNPAKQSFPLIFRFNRWYIPEFDGLSRFKVCGKGVAFKDSKNNYFPINIGDYVIVLTDGRSSGGSLLIATYRVETITDGRAIAVPTEG